MRLSRDELVPAYASLVDAVHDEGCPIIAQLARGAFYRRDFLGRLIQVEPDQMTVDDIALVRRQFVDAARRAAAAGFDGVQVHVAHFFFLSRFVSPAVNHRADEYGGSQENRARLACEIIRDIRSEVPGLHVSAKVNSSDFVQGGLDEGQTLELCRILEQAGLDSVEVSGNGTSVAGIRAHVNEGYFVGFAARLAEELSIPVIVVGGFRSREAIEQVLSKTGVAAVSLSRPLLFDPAFPNKLQAGEAEQSRCVSCNRCYSSPGHRCVMRGRL